MSPELVAAVFTGVAALVAVIVGGKHTLALVREFRGRSTEGQSVLTAIAADVKALRTEVRTGVSNLDSRVTRLEVREDSKRFHVVHGGGGGE